MATTSCRCCNAEIIITGLLCWECSGRPTDLFYITYPLADWERRRIPETCSHRPGERLAEESA